MKVEKPFAARASTFLSAVNRASFASAMARRAVAGETLAIFGDHGRG